MQFFCDYDPAEGPPYAYHYPVGMAAAYLYFGIMDHVFNDGNKRTALGSMLLFLLLNGYQIRTEDKTLVEFVVDVASGTVKKDHVELKIQQWMCEEHIKFSPEEAADYLFYYYDEVLKELSNR